MQVTKMGNTSVPITLSDDTPPVPNLKSSVESWFEANVKPYTSRKDSLDPRIVAAENGAKIIRVTKDGKGDFKTVNDALNSIPVENTNRVVVWIGGGVYYEKIVLERTKPFVTLYGDPTNVPTLVYNGTALQYGTVYSATLAVESDYFIAANLNIENSSPRPDGVRVGAQAVAMRQSGDKAAFYNCRFIGFQDTLCDDKGRHFFKDCYIQGTVDFIFGSGKSFYLNTELSVVQESGPAFITAQAREHDSEDMGYAFVHCTITGKGNSTYLGRAWRTRPRVVFAYTYMSSTVTPLGWSSNSDPAREKTVFFGDYQCSRPGSSSTGRAKFTKQLSESEAKAFLNLAYIEGSKWLLPPPKA